jgi:hypothetical protein
MLNIVSNGNGMSKTKENIKRNFFSINISTRNRNKKKAHAQMNTTGYWYGMHALQMLFLNLIYFPS